MSKDKPAGEYAALEYSYEKVKIMKIYKKEWLNDETRINEIFVEGLKNSNRQMLKAKTVIAVAKCCKKLGDC